jgi:hypothetical protein
LEQANLLVVTNQDLKELHEINKQLQEEIDAIRLELTNTKQKSTDLEKCLNDQDALIHTHDLVWLYIYYYMEPHLGEKLWSQVTGTLSDKILECKDNVITEDEFNVWIKAMFSSVTIS